MRHRLRILVLLTIACGCGAFAAPRDASGRETAERTVTVFAAASLADVFSDIGERFESQTGLEVQFAFAASSTLARQIEAGAPADVFASADGDWMTYLVDRGFIAADSRREPVGNRLVLIAPAAAAVDEVVIDAGLDLRTLIPPGERLAVGDPAHVPAGRYAQQALQTLGLWDAALTLLAPAENVRAALALVERREVPFGIVYSTDAAVSQRVRVVGTFPEATHTPIRYAFGLTERGTASAGRRFLDFLSGPSAMEVFIAHGFAP